MSISMYQASVPVFTRMLTNLSAVVEKTETHVAGKKIDPAALLTARLYPDMYPLARQMQEATKHVTWASSLLAGGDNPHRPNTESSFVELKGRISETIEFALSFKSEQIDGSENRKIPI